MIAGWIKNKKQFKEKIMTKLYLDNDRPCTVREEVLSEIWAANKKLIDGKWYVCLSDVAEIVTAEPTPEDMWDNGC